MTWARFNRPFGTQTTADSNPAVNCRAILKSPSGRHSVVCSTCAGIKMPKLRGAADPRLISVTPLGSENGQTPAACAIGPIYLTRLCLRPTRHEKVGACKG